MSALFEIAILLQGVYFLNCLIFFASASKFVLGICLWTIKHDVLANLPLRCIQDKAKRMTDLLR